MSGLRETHDALSAGEITGEALARRFGVTRSAVHKRIEALREAGVEIEAQAGRGYRLVRAIEWLERAAVLQGLSPVTKRCLTELRIEDEVDSTNAQALSTTPTEYGVQVWVAERQTAGRGRRGRAWFSTLGGGLTFSMSKRMEGGIAQLQGLSLAVGVVICETLQRAGIADAKLKWPNDVWVKDAKLAGILIELDGDAGGPLHLVAGVGLNWDLPMALRGGIDQALTDAREQNVALSRNALLAALLDGLLPLLMDYEREGFAPWRARWDAVDALRGRSLRVQVGSDWVEGEGLGIRDDGALRLHTAQGERVFHSGEVTVRPR